jgi:hypothetical protein
MELKFTESALASIIAGTILLALDEMENPPTVKGVSVILIIKIILLLIALAAIIAEWQYNIGIYGEFIGCLLLGFLVIIEFGSPNLLASLMGTFIVIDLVLGAITFIDRFIYSIIPGNDE